MEFQCGEFGIGRAGGCGALQAQVGNIGVNGHAHRMNALNINQMTRWINTKEEHCSKIITLMAEYCLCQRVKPVSDPKTPFKSEADYIAALQALVGIGLHAILQQNPPQTPGSPDCNSLKIVKIEKVMGQSLEGFTPWRRPLVGYCLCPRPVLANQKTDTCKNQDLRY